MEPKIALRMGLAGFSALTPAAVYAQAIQPEIPPGCQRAEVTSTKPIRPQFNPQFERLVQTPEFLEISKEKLRKGITTRIVQTSKPINYSSYTSYGSRAHVRPYIKSFTLPEDYWLEAGEPLDSQHQVSGEIQFLDQGFNNESWEMVGENQYYASKFDGDTLLVADFESYFTEKFSFDFNPYLNYQISNQRLEETIPDSIKQYIDYPWTNQWLAEQSKNCLDVYLNFYGAGNLLVKPLSVDNLKIILSPIPENDLAEAKNHYQNLMEIPQLSFDIPTNAEIVVKSKDQVTSKWVGFRITDYSYYSSERRYQPYETFVSSQIDNQKFFDVTPLTQPKVFKLN